MRHDQSWLVEDTVPIQHEIEIERAGGAGMRTLPPPFRFDLEKRMQQISSRGVGRADCRRIQKQRLRSGDTDRMCLVVVGDADIREVRSKTRDRVVEVRGAVAEIAAESDGG